MSRFFQGPGPGSRFLGSASRGWVQGPGSRSRVLGPGPWFGPRVGVQGSGSGSSVRVQVIEVAKS